MIRLSHLPNHPSGPQSLYLIKSGRSGSLGYDSRPAKPLAVDPKTMRVTSVICSGLRDRQGDVIDPAGVDTGEHRLNPVVYFEHGLRGYDLPIAKAEDPDGRYAVRLQDTDAGKVLVADSYFARKSQFAEEVFRLYEQDILRGWSVGVDPVRGRVLRESRGKGDRGEYEVTASTLHEYSGTGSPVNPEALTIAVEKKSGRVPLLTKAFAPYLLTKDKRPASVVGGWQGGSATPTARKAMNDEALVPPPDMPDDGMADAGSSTKPTAKAAYDGAQALLDAAEAIEAAMEAGEHVKGMAKLKKCLANIRDEAAELNAIGDMVQADTSLDDAEVEAEDSDLEEEASDLEPLPPETDDEGAILVKSGYKPRRFGFRDLRKAAPQQTNEGSDGPTPEQVQELEQLKRRLARMSRNR